MIIVSFYTIGSIYEEKVKELRESIEKLGLEYDIEGVKNRGSWRANVGHKPQFMLKMLNKHKQPVLWIDADDILVRKPEILLNNPNCDIAFAYHYESHQSAAEAAPCTAVLYVAYNETAKAILKEWARVETKLNYNAPSIRNRGMDLTSFKQVIYRQAHWALRAARLILPISYIRFSYLSKYAKIEPIIDHRNVSNQSRSMIDAMPKPACAQKKLGSPQECHKPVPSSSVLTRRGARSKNVLTLTRLSHQRKGKQ